VTKCFHSPIGATSFSDEKMQKVNLYESAQLFCDVYCLLPGQSQKAHTHADNDKIYHVLEGVCDVQIGDQTQSLEAGELAVAPASVIHGVTNNSDSPASILVIMAPHPNYNG